MHTLFLLRHAKASHHPACHDDHERPLTERGVKDAFRLGEYLAHSGLPVPEQVLCSDAARTRQTAEQLCLSLSSAPAAEYRRALYLATPGEILSQIQLTKAAHALMVIGHNPGIHQLAFSLAGRDACGQRPHLSMTFPTAALAVLSFPGLEHWKGIAPQSGTLDAFLTPKELPDND